VGWRRANDGKAGLLAYVMRAIDFKASFENIMHHELMSSWGFDKDFPQIRRNFEESAEVESLSSVWESLSSKWT
jgi:hypothetical protein